MASFKCPWCGKTIECEFITGEELDAHLVECRVFNRIMNGEQDTFEETCAGGEDYDTDMERYWG